MTTPRDRSSRLRAAGLGALVLALAACEAPAPTALQPVPVERVYTAPGAPEGLQPSRVTPREMVAQHFPDVLTRGMQGKEYVMFVLDPAGNVVSSRMGGEVKEVSAGQAGPTDGSTTVFGQVRISPTDDMGIDPDRVTSVEVMKFRPGQIGPDAVGVVWVRTGEPGQAAATTRVRVPAGKSSVSAETVREAVRRYVPSRVTGPASQEPVWFVTSAAGEVLRYGESPVMGALNQYRPEEIDQVDVFKGDRVSFDGREVPVIWVRLKA